MYKIRGKKENYTISDIKCRKLNQINLKVKN